MFAHGTQQTANRKRSPNLLLTAYCLLLACTSTGIEEAPEWAQETVPTDEQYTQIQAAFLREDFEQVVTLAQPLLVGTSLAPDGAFGTPDQAGKTTRMWLWCVISLERLQRLNDALREMDRLKLAVSRLSPPAVIQAGIDRSWPEILFWEGEISRGALKMVRARLAYQRLLTEYPASSWKLHAQFGLGLVLFHQQAYEEASRYFHEVVELPSASPIARQALVLEGMCRLQLKQFDDALVIFRQELEQPLEPTQRAQDLFYLGEALTGLGRFEEAVEAYTQAIEVDPTSRWAHMARFGLGWSEFQRHRCHESLDAFHAYLSDRPHPNVQGAPHAVSEVPLELLFAQGRCLMELGDETGAVARFDALRARDPEHALAMEAALSQAELLQGQGRFTDARFVVETILRQAFEPVQIAQANLRLAALELAQGDATQAIEHFQVARDVDNLNVQQAAWNGLADAHLLLGDSDEATRDYDVSLHLAPGSAPGLYAAYQLGRLMLQAGHVPEAEELLQRVAEGQDPALAAEAQFALILAHLSSAQPARARLELDQMVSRDPTSSQSARAGYYLALFALQDGRMDEAKTRCQDVIQRAPASDEAFEAHLLLVDLAAGESSVQEALAVLTRWVEALSASQTTGTKEWRTSLPRRSRGKLEKKFGDLLRKTLAYAPAIHWYEAAWEDLPAQHGELAYRLASCYEEAGDVAVAIQRYQAIDQPPWQIRGQLAAAKLMERAERRQEAMTIYEHLARQSAPEAKIAEERLLLLGKTRP